MRLRSPDARYPSNLRAQRETAVSGRHFGTMRGTAVQRDVRGACASCAACVAEASLGARQAGGVMIRE